MQGSDCSPIPRPGKKRMTNDRQSPLHLEAGNKATDKARSRTYYWAEQTQMDADTTNPSMYVRAIKVVQEFFRFSLVSL